jgi:hypothetical protein
MNLERDLEMEEKIAGREGHHSPKTSDADVRGKQRQIIGSITVAKDQTLVS